MQLLPQYNEVTDVMRAWLIAAFHNTQRKALMEAISFRFSPQLRPRVPSLEHGQD